MYGNKEQVVVQVDQGLKQEVDSLSSSLAQKATEINQRSKQIYNNIRRQNKGIYRKYALPSYFDFAGVTILTDGFSFVTNFDVSNFKFTGGTTYYVDPVNGNNANNGLTEATAVKRVHQALTLCASGDTIILLDGIYTRDTWLTNLSSNSPIEKSVNIIAKNSGKVTVTESDDLTYTATANPGVYTTSRSNVLKVIDITNLVSSNISFELEKVTTLAACISTENSYFVDTDGSTVYVHMYGNQQPTNANLRLNINTTVPLLNVVSSTANVTLYVEGINFIGGSLGTCRFSNSASYLTPKLYAKNSKFKHGYSTVANGKDAVTITGATTIFQNCEASFSSKDGFNYHGSYGQVCYAIEINCLGYGNGKGWQDFTCNGSTIHDGGKILRLNGIYYNNYGGNVADVNVNTVSYNLGCIAFDSLSKTKDVYDGDFVAQQTGATMYLDNCKAFGSANNVHAVAGATVNVYNSEYDTITGTGTLNVT